MKGIKSIIYKHYIVEIDELNQLVENGYHHWVKLGKIPEITYSFYIYDILLGGTDSDFLEGVSYDSVEEGISDIKNYIDEYIDN